MDMTLPSYDTISDAKNTQESLSSLVIEQPTAVPSKAARKQKGEQMKGPSMSSLLPSLDKQGPKKKETTEEAAAKKAQQGKRANQIDRSVPTDQIVLSQAHNFTLYSYYFV